MNFRNPWCFVACLFTAGQTFGATTPGEPFRVGERVLPLLENYCVSCHEDGTTKGDVRLDNLASLSLDARSDLLNRVQEQVFFGEMPPKKKKQPTEAERNLLAEWVSKELRAHNASNLEDKLRMPEYGNVVDHDKLFSGKYKDLPSYTPDRRWLISEFIFDAKFNKLLDYVGQRDIDRKRQHVIGDNGRNGVNVNLTNPFLLPTHSGVRYYDTTALDGGHLLTMITNAKEVSAFMIARAKKKNYLPAIETIMAAEWAHEKILADRESYLNANIEQLLRELYKERNERLLPVFVATKPAPPAATVGPDGKPLKKSVFDIAAPGREDLEQIWAAIQRNSQNGEKDEALIVKCERDWIIFGVNERTIQLRVAFMRGYMEDLVKRLPKANSGRAAKAPAESEMAIIRAAILKHRKAGDRFNAIIAKCMAE